MLCVRVSNVFIIMSGDEKKMTVFVPVAEASVEPKNVLVAVVADVADASIGENNARSKTIESESGIRHDPDSGLNIYRGVCYRTNHLRHYRERRAGISQLWNKRSI
jgi:hypothetical protein